jgi:hypothetical protein
MPEDSILSARRNTPARECRSFSRQREGGIWSFGGLGAALLGVVESSETSLGSSSTW